MTFENWTDIKFLNEFSDRKQYALMIKHNIEGVFITSDLMKIITSQTNNDKEFMGIIIKVLKPETLDEYKKKVIEAIDYVANCIGERYPNRAGNPVSWKEELLKEMRS